ncbi:hypothetical protein [Pseudomonas sp. ICMP 460]|uniref:hypothetical protein n=1 Tax=Pseudomonas sp. ICMP 460 TaxID=1718917 RepID=UPI000C083D4E|nr:hypothetical protein [Pseudomonas sp. ICMP 460]PHN24856.1 hypothetical protein AO240_14865 [Pseudomonas sp. ICMP 460]
MKMEDLRYYTMVTLLVLASAGFNTMLILWIIEQFTSLSRGATGIAAIAIFIVISIAGLIHAIPRLRGVI